MDGDGARDLGAAAKTNGQVTGNREEKVGYRREEIEAAGRIGRQEWCLSDGSHENSRRNFLPTEQIGRGKDQRL